MAVPFVIVTGFLGSGKTTLINSLLTRRARRATTGTLAIVVNELGEIGIDGQLIGDGSSRQVELPGGCVCCVLGEQLDATLIELCARAPDAIVLETSGAAEPLPIAWAVARDPVGHYVRLAAVVTVVDAVNFIASRSVSAAVDAQVAYADVVLISKAELATDDQLAAVLAAVAELAPSALVRRAATDEHAAWLEALLADPDLPVRGARAGAPHGEPGHIHDDDCRQPDNASAGHAHSIDSVWVPIDGVIDLEELEDRLAALPANYVRIKGIARAVDPRTGAGEPAWTVFHRVGSRVSSERIEPAGPGRAVALGPGVDRAKLAECVEATIVERDKSR